MAIDCCKDCVAPKRHLGCHSKCKDYKAQKEKLEQKRKARIDYLREHPNSTLSEYDFNKSTFTGIGTKRRYKVKY